jgi:acetoin utilization deacetylase AcuC-like enzyme
LKVVFHEDDWDGTLSTEDFTDIGRMVRGATNRHGGGYFAILEGGYNHQILGYNALALIQGLSGN